MNTTYIPVFMERNRLSDERTGISWNNTLFMLSGENSNNALQSRKCRLL